jgi:hypothetical protein
VFNRGAERLNREAGLTLENKMRRFEPRSSSIDLATRGGHVPRAAEMLVVFFSLAGLRVAAQAPPSPAQATTVAAAEKAAVAAVTFREGDLTGFGRARVDFTSNGWDAFLKRMQGFLDSNGAPTFTSSFTASGSASVLGERDGIVYFRVPGTLVQSNRLGKTTYRAALEVHAGGSPVRIERLDQITCVGASTACQ